MEGTSLMLPHEVAMRCGVTPASVRAWERNGVLVPAARTATGVRLYDKAEVDRLVTVRNARDTRASRPTARG